MKKNVNLKVNLTKKLSFKNPVLTASGTFGYGIEFSKFLDLNKLGGISVKGISLEPKIGNPMPRIYETPSGMLNAIGLQNIGSDVFINDKLPKLRKFDTKVIVNFFGNTKDEYVKTAKKLSNAKGISALEMNISCPNIKKGGISFGSDPKSAFSVISKVRSATKLPLIVKLSPNVTDITVIAKAAEDAGADSISLINTLLGMSIDIKTRRSRIANITAGLSGPAIKPVAIRMVWQVYNTVKIPIIGMGGIMNASDAIEFIIAGAAAIQVGTANFIDPKISVKIIDGIKDYCLKNNIEEISTLIGSLEV